MKKKKKTSEKKKKTVEKDVKKNKRKGKEKREKKEKKKSKKKAEKFTDYKKEKKSKKIDKNKISFKVFHFLKKIASWLVNFWEALREKFVKSLVSLKAKLKNIGFVKKVINSEKFKKVQSKYSKFKKWAKKNEKVRWLSKVVRYVLLVVGLYLIIYPFAPGIIFKLKHENKEFYPYQTKLTRNTSNAEYAEEAIPSDNRLVIPSINVDMVIVEGETEASLDIGVWHRPGTGIPGSGNMVLTGHRVGYAFLPSDIKASTSFYNLDKLEVGDYVIVYWKGKEYDYEVYDWEIVEPTAKYIENQDVGERLTMYTCHPLGQLSKRLVYYAKPIEEQNI